MHIDGVSDSAFSSVLDVFTQLLEDPEQRGAALCVQVAGETVMDLWGGVIDRHGEQLWQRDTLVNIFSSGKPVAAVLLLQLVAEGRLQLDVPLADYWPEFAAQGKQHITLRQVLSHQAGLPAVLEPLAAEALYDWSRMISAVQNTPPWWTPGSAHGYAPMTYGWLVGELIRRIEGCEPGEAIARRIAQPLQLELYLGLTDQQLPRVGDVMRMKAGVSDPTSVRLMQSMGHNPRGMTAKAFANPPSMMTSTNKLEWRRMQQPAANAHSTARGLAGFYTGLLQGQLLDGEMLREMLTEQSEGMDLTLLTHTRFGLGCMLEQADQLPASYALGARSFGHPGAGGTLGCADPEREVSVAFITNSLGASVLMDPRAQKINAMLKKCL
ncbi:MAG: beta-lactamase family protein [Pseudomonas sp.]|jgi:CubicO group peptidase (beta-lactamase class C family)|nr:beta-lactamase family protein [Pseudomonas sp.]MDD2222964.1 serine hydrolase [Pseudomonas sp.]MDY0413419.1 serine hydrolase domain-containing protein [Pseudomonas sp.]NLO55111.1 beta-lactamase family protein [Gammaproteobacteria bacterium]